MVEWERGEGRKNGVVVSGRAHERVEPSPLRGDVLIRTSPPWSIPSLSIHLQRLPRSFDD